MTASVKYSMSGTIVLRPVVRIDEPELARLRLEGRVAREHGRLSGELLADVLRGEVPQLGRVRIPGPQVGRVVLVVAQRVLAAEARKLRPLELLARRLGDHV